MSYILGKDEGLFNPSLKFAFTNITTEDFTSAWGGSPIVVKAGQTIELQHHLADKLTNELVDKIMIGGAKMDEVKYYESHPDAAPNSFRSPQGTSLGVPAARYVYEEQIVRQMDADEESPELQVIRAELKAELLAAANGEQMQSTIEMPNSVEEFADLTKKPVKAPKKPIKVKEVPKE